MEILGRILHIVAVIAVAWLFIASYNEWRKINK